MLPTDIRTSVTCDVIRSIEADVAAEVCDNNNIHGVHYTPSDNNVYDIRPIEEELEDEQVAKRNKSMKVERNNSNLCSSQMRACMRSGGDLTLLNPLLRPMLDSLSMKLFGDNSKYQRFCEIYVELNVKPNVEIVKPFIYYVNIMTGERTLDEFKPTGFIGNKTDLCLIFFERFKYLPFCMPSDGFVPKLLIENKEVLKWCKKKTVNEILPPPRRFGAGRPIAPYLSRVDSTFYIRIVLFVPLVFLNSVIFTLIEFM